MREILNVLCSCEISQILGLVWEVRVPARWSLGCSSEGTGLPGLEWGCAWLSPSLLENVSSGIRDAAAEEKAESPGAQPVFLRSPSARTYLWVAGGSSLMADGRSKEETGVVGSVDYVWQNEVSHQTVEQTPDHSPWEHLSPREG